MSPFSEAFTRSILDAAARGTTIVLPSELAAEFWRYEIVRCGALPAIREHRIASWDRFKERAFELRTDRRPANRVVRAVFARQLIGENGQARFLQRVVPPSAAASADGFRDYLAQILSVLPRRRALEGPGAQDPELGRLVTDLRALEHRYTAFLDAHELYEPAWLERAPAYRGGDHLLVMPELAEDYPEFAPALAEVPRVAIPEAELPQLQLHPDSRTELETTLGAIAGLLDSGVAPESIALTVGDLETLRSRLHEAAQIAEVPLSFRQGIPLASSAAGRFLTALGEVVSSGFGLGPMKRMLLNRAVPWKSYATNANLVAGGARAGCLGGGGRPDPRWRRVRGEPERALVDLLMGELPVITGASSVASLRSRLFRLLARLIDRDRWDPREERLLQRCLEELRSLADMEASGLRIPSPYRFWMDLLASQLYVPRGLERGVAVLPYRVGALLYPDHHFVVNASNRATTVRIRRYPFLTEAEREQIGGQVADRTLTDLFLRAYAVSGRSVTVSCGRTGFDGPALPPGDFVAGGCITNAPAGASARLAWRSEERFEAFPARVYRLQAEGAQAYAATARRPGASDLTRQPLGTPQLVDGALNAQRHRGGQELISLSAADIEGFRACPFSYLLARVLRLRDPELEVDPDNPRDIGTLYHEALEELFRELHDRGDRFSPSLLDEYARRLGEIVRRHGARGPGMVPVYVYEAIEPLTERVFARLLEHDARLIAGHTVELVEEWGRRVDLETGVYLAGRIDRVTRGQDGGLTLVDYKKRSVPTGKALAAGSREATGVGGLPEPERAAERDLLGSIQIPFYISLLEHRNERVTGAVYYSLEEGKPVPVIADDTTTARPVMTRERLDEIIVLVDDIVRETTRRLAAGDYRCAASHGSDGGRRCAGCVFRGVCRTRFVVE